MTQSLEEPNATAATTGEDADAMTDGTVAADPADMVTTGVTDCTLDTVGPELDTEAEVLGCCPAMPPPGLKQCAQS